MCSFFRGHFLTEYETETGGIDSMFDDHTFDRSPLGLLSTRNSRFAVPLARLVPENHDFGNITYICYNRKTSVTTIKDSQGFVYYYITKWKQEKDAVSAEKILSCDKSDPMDARLVVSEGRLKMQTASVMFEADVKLFLSIMGEDEDFDQKHRVDVLMYFCKRDAKTVSVWRNNRSLTSSSTRSSRSDPEILMCDDRSSPQEILTCLVKGEDTLPDFRSTVSTYADKGLSIGSVTRDFCSNLPLRS